MRQRVARPPLVPCDDERKGTRRELWVGVVIPAPRPYAVHLHVGSIMKRSLTLLALVATVALPLACTDASATTAPPSVVITLFPAFSASGVCAVASPDPASIRAGEAVAFRNETGVTHTVIADGGNTPWTTIAPGETSGSIEFSIASTRKYYLQACGDAPVNLHTLIVTVN